jgi:hypothetical protein
LLQSSWTRSAEVATVFKSAREVIRVLQADHNVVERVVAKRPTVAYSIVPVLQRTPSQCWDAYTRDVVHFTYELQSCLNSASYAWWNPLATGFCAYEYNLKSSLAAIWLLDCYGVPV